MKLKYYLITLLTLGYLQLNAQVPVPASDQTAAIALKGATVHIGNGNIIENGIVAFDKGLLTLIGTSAEVGDLSNYKVVEVSGKHIYPGFILPNSRIGLDEVSAVRAMNDTDEVGDMAPNVRSLIAYNSDSKIIPTLRYNGVLVAETTPAGGRISGTSSVMNMDGWNWEDAAMKTDVAVHMNWPQVMSGTFDFATFSFNRGPNKKYKDQVEEVTSFVKQAMAYGKMKGSEPNLKLEGMQGLFDGSKILMLHAGSPQEIIDGVSSMKEAGIKKITLVTNEAALGVAEFISSHNIPVVLPPIHQLPDSDDDDVYAPFKLASDLTAKGITVSLSHSGMLARARNLPFYAGSTAAFGLKKEEAVKLITYNAAVALGIENELGTLEKGKRATLFVTNGDPLDMMTNDLTHAFIDGKEIILDGEQQMLFERYSKKYGE